ncbi:hypothetical protein [Candidatus Vondammii sp. HM_W22]|uniref:hypothetical protein n=1 Tax=Candidatus Vondammii sp. HM_W22 TaxID=2687299 RepID=UPI001F12D0F6|nr:hypothetical protein [Candidatus Vondammii sp. HM_W22]
MAIKSILFPEQSRSFPGQRWTNILLRTLHLIGLAGVGGVFFYPVADNSWMPYFYLAMASGIGLMAISIWSNGVWLVQLRGQSILLKVFLLTLIPPFPEAKIPLFLAVIIISGLIAHAPGNIRYYSLYHRRRIEML